jgi:uncharacterized membrane protein YfcA
MTGASIRPIVIGLLAGIVSGLFGVGGGVVVVPGLMLWLHFDQRLASGTSVAVIIASTTVTAITFGIAGSVDWGAAALVACGAMPGAAIGARIMHRIPAVVLTRVFAFVMLVAAVRLVLP